MAIEPVDRTSGDADTDVKTSAKGAHTPATGPPTASDRRAAPDASDVVTGPVGSARLKDPTAPGIRGADLAKLDSTTVTSTD
jgi:hypothetical protein